MPTVVENRPLSLKSNNFAMATAVNDFVQEAIHVGLREVDHSAAIQPRRTTKILSLPGYLRAYLQASFKRSQSKSVFSRTAAFWPGVASVLAETRVLQPPWAADGG